MQRHVTYLTPEASPGLFGLFQLLECELCIECEILRRNIERHTNGENNSSFLKKVNGIQIETISKNTDMESAFKVDLRVNSN